MRTLLLALLFVLLNPAVMAGTTVTVTDAWINEAPPGVRVLAAYMVLANNSGTAIELVSADSSLFEKIEFHVTRMDYGVASMHKQDRISIPANSSFRFTPGGYHLMLFNPVEALHGGDKVLLQLQFSNGETIQVETEVRRGGSEHGHSH